MPSNMSGPDEAALEDTTVPPSSNSTSASAGAAAGTSPWAAAFRLAPLPAAGAGASAPKTSPPATMSSSAPSPTDLTTALPGSRGSTFSFGPDVCTLDGAAVRAGSPPSTGVARTAAGAAAAPWGTSAGAGGEAIVPLDSRLEQPAGRCEQILEVGREQSSQERGWRKPTSGEGQLGTNQPASAGRS